MSIIISSDSHIIEPADMFDRIEVEYREQAPRLESDADGNHAWHILGRRIGSASTGSEVGKRFEDPASLRMSAPFGEVRLGGYRPDSQVEENAQDGVAGSVLYPTLGLQVLWVEDRGLLAAICRAYNSWLADFCSYAPARLKGVALLALDDVAAAVVELQRAREIGLSGVCIPVGAPGGRRYGSAEFDDFWAAAADLDMPVSLHIGSHRTWGEGVRGNFVPSALATPDYWQRVSICDMIYGGAFLRHPNLRFGSVECELGWIPFFLEKMDYLYTQSPHGTGPEWSKLPDGTLPSDVFRKNVFVSFQQDALGIQHRDVIGIDGLMFGSDYPHPESTFPRTRQVMDDLLADVPDAERAKLLYGNVADLYHFDVEQLEREALVA